MKQTHCGSEGLADEQQGECQRVGRGRRPAGLFGADVCRLWGTIDRDQFHPSYSLGMLSLNGRSRLLSLGRGIGSDRQGPPGIAESYRRSTRTDDRARPQAIGHSSARTIVKDDELVILVQPVLP
jgi:hypothetical protein